MRRRGQSRTITAVSTAALLAAASYSVSYAQQAEEEAGLRLTVDVGTGVSVTENAGLDDPSEGTTTSSTTSLDFGLISETRSSRLIASVSTGLRFRDEPESDDEAEFIAPDSFVTYTREGANSAFALNVRFRDEELDERVLTFLDEDLRPVDFLVDGGNLQQLSASAQLSLGIEGPLGFTGNVFYNTRDYSDTIDPELYDRTTFGASAVTSLRFSDVLTGSITASASEFDAEDAAETERTTTSLGVGLAYDISPRTTVSGNVSYDQIETTEFGVFTETTDGLGFAVSAVTELANGTVGGSLQRTINTAGERTAISFDRAMELPTGSLSYGLGYTFSDDGEDRLTAQLALGRDLPRGSLSASLSQQAATNDEDEQVLFTRAAVTYTQDINNVSGFTVDFGLGRTEEIGSGGGDETTRANLGVTYRRELTSEWDWALGYRTQYLRENAGDGRNSNTIFTRIDRSFSIRP